MHYVNKTSYYKRETGVFVAASEDVSLCSPASDPTVSTTLISQLPNKFHNGNFAMPLEYVISLIR